MIAIVRAAMVLIFIEGLINGTGFNGYYTPSTTAPAADHHQPSQELKYTNRQNALGLGATASIPTVLALAGYAINLTRGRILLRFYTLVCYMRDAPC